jgi:hypothetical protein
MTNHPQPGNQPDPDDMPGSSNTEEDAQDLAAAHRTLAAEEEVAGKLGDLEARSTSKNPRGGNSLLDTEQ